MKKYFITALILFILFITSPASAKNLYVDWDGGNDATTWENNDAENPWDTFAHAVGNAIAGDVVTVAPGTYSTASNESKFLCSFQSTNSGTPGNYIIYQAEVSAVYAEVLERTILQHTGTGCVIGGFQDDYVKWIGFYIDLANATPHSDTGPAVAWDSDYVFFEENIFIGVTVSWGQENYNGVRIEDSTYVTVKNNKISGFISSNDNGRISTGITGYNSQNIIVENNEIYGSGSGIYPKGSGSAPFQEDWTIRYNLIYDNNHGIVFGGIDRADVYQNVIRDHDSADQTGIRIFGYSDPVPNDLNIYNNTVHNCYRSFMVGSDFAYSGNLIYDNIFSDETNIHIYWEVANTSMYYSANRTRFTYNFYDTFAGNVDWATWTGATYGQDGGGSDGVDPGFVNEANDNFKLDTGSAALTASSTSGSVGAYITGNEEIGIEWAGEEDSITITIDGGGCIITMGGSETITIE